MAKKMNKTTAKDFKVFKKEALYWIDKLHLREWDIEFFHRENRNSDLANSLAWNVCASTAKGARIGLSKDWGDVKPTRNQVAKTAFHEIIEILLGDLYYEATWDACPSQTDTFERIRHAIVRRLEWALWEPDWTRRNQNRRGWRNESNGRSI